MPNNNNKLLTFADLSKPVSFKNCDELADGICSILRGWDIHEVSNESADRPIIRLANTTRGYRRVSPWLCKPSLSRAKLRRGLVAGICSFHFELIDWYIEENKDLLGLHCAAAEFDDGLVIFPTQTRSGKSTLSIHLAAHGVRLFCDDVLPIEPINNHGVALGILPRLRIPLPAKAGAIFHKFVHKHKGPHNNQYLYVSLAQDQLAPLGETAPIQGIVLLQRKSKGTAQLIPVDKGDILSEIIQQNFVRQASSVQILDRLHNLVNETECYKLTYSSGAQATKLLKSTFDSLLKQSAADG